MEIEEITAETVDESTGGDTSSKKLDIDEIYAEIHRRLRRDLLLERERTGRLSRF